MEEKEQEEQIPELKPLWRSFPVIFAGVSGLVLVVLLVVLFLGSDGKEAEKEAEKKGNAKAKEAAPVEEPLEPGVVVIEDPDGVLTGAMVRLDPFVVNLGADDVFFNFSIILEFYDFSPPEDMELFLPKIRDTILLTVSKKSAKKLLLPLGKERLRVELIVELNKLFGDQAEIVDIYYTDYLIQEENPTPS